MCYAEAHMKLQVGVKALINNRHGQYLFIKRTKELPTGEGIVWDIPGGRLSPDEDKSLGDALRREVAEEVGMSISGTPKLLEAQDILSLEADLHVIRLTFEVTATGTVRLSDEHQEFAWLSLEAARKLATDPYLKELLLRFKSTAH